MACSRGLKATPESQVNSVAHWSDRHSPSDNEGGAMGKRARKKKDRRKNKANHGKRPSC